MTLLFRLTMPIQRDATRRSRLFDKAIVAAALLLVSIPARWILAPRAHARPLAPATRTTTSPSATPQR